MGVDVKIPMVLRKHVGGDTLVEAQPGTLGDVLNGLTERYPGLKDELFDDDGELRRFVNVYINDEDVRYLDGLDSKVSEDDSVSILPAVAGGR